MTDVFDNDEYCVAGFMGNLYAESHCLSVCVQPSHFDDVVARQYVADVNSGTKTKYVFAHDGKGFGLPQWTYYTRKEDLYDFLKDTQLVFDIGNLDGQLAFIKHEFENSFASLKTSMQNVTGTDQEKVYKCADLVLENYEKPKVYNYTDRRNYALEIYNHYAGTPISGHAVNVVIENPDGNYGTAYALPAVAEYNSIVRLYYEQQEGLTFEGFTSNDISISSDNTFSMPNHSVTILAHFSGTPTYPPSTEFRTFVTVASGLDLSYFVTPTIASAGTRIDLFLITLIDLDTLNIQANVEFTRTLNVIQYTMPQHDVYFRIGFQSAKTKLLVARNPQLMVTKRRTLL